MAREELKLHTGQCGWQLRVHPVRPVLVVKIKTNLLVYMEGTKQFKKLQPTNTHLPLL
jgi:hypothetical protein